MKSMPVVGGLPRGYSLCGAILVAAVLGLAALALGLVGAKPASAQDVASSQAAFFDESTDTIQVSGQTVIGTTSTYEAVISLSSAPDRQSLVFNEWTANAEDKQLQAGPSRLVGYNYSGSAIVADSPTLSADTWHHVAYVYDGNQQRLYLDGTLVDSQAAGGEVGDGSGPAHVGAIFRDGRINTGFVGYIDSLRISDVARYSDTSFTPPSGDMASDANTQLLYNFNDPAGSTTVQDSGPLGRTGTLGAGFTGATSPQLGATAPQDQDTTAPTVTNTSPANDATGIASSANVEATFSEDMDASDTDGDPSTLTTSTFTLIKQGSSTPVGAAVSYDSASKKATLDPTSDLEASTTYTATIKGGSTGAEDLAGNALAQDHTWTFTTAAPPAPACTLTGTANAETISGTSGDDVICAGGGNDTVKGLGGNDTLKGEAGNDKLLGGVGNDTLDGGLGADTASYSASLTAVTASLATNAATGEGSDTFTGVEKLMGSRNADTLTGSDANNILKGGGGNDTLRAGAGNDKVVGSGGADFLYGEDGSDAVNSLDGVNGNDSLDGGAGTDTKTTDASEKSVVGFP